MNARRVALECLLTLSHSSASIASVVDSAFGRRPTIDGRERRLVNGLVYGVIRWQKQLDWVLDRFINPKFQLDGRRRNILRLGAFQLLHLDGIPAHAAIFETVQLATSRQRKSSGDRKTAGFINAVLRSIQREGASIAYPSLSTNPTEHIAFSLSYPTWLVKRWLQTRGVSWTLAFCRASNQTAPLAFRVNTLLTQREEVCQFLEMKGLPASLSKIAPDGITLKNRTITNFDTTGELTLKDILNRKDIYVQDESAMLVAPLLSPEEAGFIVDLCAAPGGKTTHLAHLMRNTGKIIAVDTSAEKIALLQKNCRRVNAHNVETCVMDATKADLAFIKTADAVLIDAPCSGFGTLRRHPDIRWNKTLKQVHALREVQYNLLKNAAPHIKPGGILVYSTCSIEPMENEEVIQRFLTDFPMYRVENARRFLPAVPLSAITPQGFVQTFPHEHGVDGAFAARLRQVPIK
ncbi:16S rRNA (cytosine(967)-C(5))-methyltransferase RsmB [Candidatus Poribacteria bacterium]|nr:16S rRNA (cytosine(967)-C(5))-methyltransferase RsmB [Candidatus Poribacteria bacterium]MYA55864.1 16S rRNA (cytosine(967)-C(5))-methyltransferase RsmB [Candidatus Poribacteria bacterium]